MIYPYIPDTMVELPITLNVTNSMTLHHRNYDPCGVVNYGAPTPTPTNRTVKVQQLLPRSKEQSPHQTP